ncbi:amidase signature enzyme [Karstenula rhodostoma CBS 690.94]|uniref:Amidase signature enzyme n=1 Tax=Karstenula rhodostoma CBS 690.94 TaxID=1392251 RepID=A0A9P4PL42_9PLEO|nr:amidase signature enzyme [Karstenula rhodostoma CBS 690.94]
MVTLKPQSKTSHAFESFRLKSSDDHFSTFALESRIKTQARPGALAGTCIVVKDNIDFKGMKNSVGNKAFYDVCPPRNESATCIQPLNEKGVVVVDKAKMSSFANWEEPIESTDYQAPWNPREDGYQSPGGSSSGSAAAAATYDWLDIAIGTDTWGSVTRPALWCGCYGLRPSFGAVASGIEPCCQVYDTAGILGRDLHKCRDFAVEWLSPAALQSPPMSFASIIWPIDFWKPTDAKQNAIAQAFAQQMKTFLNAEYAEVSFEATWLASPPAQAASKPLPEYINEACDMQEYDAYHNLDDFRENYHRQYNHAPYVSPPNQKSWKFTKTISKEARNKGFARLDVYKKWFEDAILAANNNNNTLIIMPQESMQSRYRDELPTYASPIHPRASTPLL